MVLTYAKKFLFYLTLSISCFAEDLYDFKGKHFIASYNECDPLALTNVEELIKAMEVAVQKSGATILGSSFYKFPGEGLTMVLLLSESHASIHTYPEFGACFIDLFTCGDHCSYEGFHESLASYLKPTQIDQKVLIRKQQIEENQ